MPWYFEFSQILYFFFFCYVFFCSTRIMGACTHWIDTWMNKRDFIQRTVLDNFRDDLLIEFGNVFVTTALTDRVFFNSHFHEFSIIFIYIYRKQKRMKRFHPSIINSFKYIAFTNLIFFKTFSQQQLTKLNLELINYGYATQCQQILQ